jgi:3-oxoacyl-[acyl-carrier protein] reductase
MAEPREVVVTGGGTGIGYAIAARFAKAGDRVTITGRRAGVLSEAAILLGARYAVFDASDPAAVTAALDELPERVDVLVNNAGGNTDFDRGAPDDLTGLAANWRANFDANVLTTVLVTAALTPRLSDGARIVSLGRSRPGRAAVPTPRRSPRSKAGTWTSPRPWVRAASPRTWSRPAWSRTPSSSAAGCPASAGAG